MKIWILRFLDDFWPKSRFTLFGTLFTLFLAGVKNYYISAISPINIGQISQIAKKLWEVKILTSKKRQILYINRSRKTFVREIFKCYQFYSDFWHICDRDDVLILTYEYVLKNKEEVFQNLAKFMDLPSLKKEEMKLILEKCSKEWMYN